MELMLFLVAVNLWFIGYSLWQIAVAIEKWSDKP